MPVRLLLLTCARAEMQQTTRRQARSFMEPPSSQSHFGCAGCLCQGKGKGKRQKSRKGHSETARQRDAGMARRRNTATPEGEGKRRGGHCWKTLRLGEW